MEAKERKQKDMKDQLNRERRYLLRKLSQLKEDDSFSADSLRIRSISESSSGFSSISTSPTYEGKISYYFTFTRTNSMVHLLDEVGYMTSSTASDVEDQSSGQSDCGVTIIMERLDVQPDSKSDISNSASEQLEEMNSIDWLS